MKKKNCQLSEILTYLCGCWLRLTKNNLTFKLFILSVIVCVDMLLLHGQAMASTVEGSANLNGPWDDISRGMIWALGPLDRSILAVIVFFFILDILLGVTIAVIKGVFQGKKVFYSLLKACVYLILLSVAWQFRQPGIVEIPFLGDFISYALESFILGTEAISVIKNADLLLRIIGTDLPFLRPMISFIERNLKDRQDTLFGKNIYKVIVVDDNPLIRKIVTEFLDNMGVFDVVVHGSLGTAIETALRKPHDVVILDLHLPDAKGEETYNTFVTKVPNIPIVVLTGTSDEKTLDKVRSSGAKWILSKPNLKQAELIATIMLAIDVEKRIKTIETKVGDLKLKQTLLPEEVMEDKQEN